MAFLFRPQSQRVCVCIIDEEETVTIINDLKTHIYSTGDGLQQEHWDGERECVYGPCAASLHSLYVNYGWRVVQSFPPSQPCDTHTLSPVAKMYKWSRAVGQPANYKPASTVHLIFSPQTVIYPFARVKLSVSFCQLPLPCRRSIDTYSIYIQCNHLVFDSEIALTRQPWDVCLSCLPVYSSLSVCVSEQVYLSAHSRCLLCSVSPRSGRGAGSRSAIARQSGSAADGRPGPPSRRVLFLSCLALSSQIPFISSVCSSQQSLNHHRHQLFPEKHFSHTVSFMFRDLLHNFLVNGYELMKNLSDIGLNKNLERPIRKEPFNFFPHFVMFSTSCWNSLKPLSLINLGSETQNDEAEK